jgi:hypothetical protein
MEDFNKFRTRLSIDQIIYLWNYIHEISTHPKRIEVAKISSDLELPEKVIRTWFQNYYARHKDEFEIKSEKTPIKISEISRDAFFELEKISWEDIIE